MTLLLPTVARRFCHCALPPLVGGHLLQGPGDAVGTAHRQAPLASRVPQSSTAPFILLLLSQPATLQLALMLRVITKGSDNHFKFLTQTAESTKTGSCVLHCSEKSCLFFLSFEGLVKIGINPQLIAQGPDHRFIHLYLNHVLKS